MFRRDMPLLIARGVDASASYGAFSAQASRQRQLAGASLRFAFARLKTENTSTIGLMPG
jgi:hypothetical protein